MNPSWFADLATRAMAAAPWPDPRFPPSPYYRFLRYLAQAHQPTLSVELGLCGGGGSFHLAIGWPGGTVVGVEHAVGDDQQRANWSHVQGKCSNFVLWKGDSVGDSPEIFKRYGACGLLFIDTIHTTERTIEEWEAWMPYMAPRAVVCLDDVQRREMAGLWDWVPWPKMRLDFLHSGGLDVAGFGDGGFGVAWRDET